MLNLNDFAIEITKQEAGKTQVSITQVKEIMKIIFTKIAKMPAEERMAFMTKLPSNTNNKTGGTIL